MDYTITIDTPLGDDALLVEGFTGLEGVSQLFKFNLAVLSKNSSIEFGSIIGQNVTISLVLADQSPRYINGYVSSFSQSGYSLTFAHYQLEVVPWLWFLTRNADCRIFQNMTIPDIIQQIFTDRGFTDFKSSLTGSYSPRDYCVQYRETDFNFVSRLMEEQGIFYFFQHEKGKHTLVMGDSSSTFQTCPGQATANFDTATDGAEESDAINSIHMEQELRTGKYSLADYVPETPNSILSSEATIDEVDGNTAYEIFDFPGEYLNQSQGNALSKIRMQEEEASHLIITGSGSCRAFASGTTFELQNYYRDDMNTSYLLTEIQHLASASGHVAGGGGGGSHYSNSFTCIPADVPYRPPRVTPKPFVQGAQTALVVGKQGEEIWVDASGRITVLFPWDRKGACSCWIRVSQEWAGQGYGAIAIPRIGQEVIVSFLEGDPDRPIVTGRVYNSNQHIPYPLPAYQTRSTFMTRSSKGGDSSTYNELRFEDKMGEEQVFLRAQLDQDNYVKHDSREWIGNNRSLVVTKDQMESVGGDLHSQVTGNVFVKVTGNTNLQVTGDVKDAVTGNVNSQITGNFVEAVTGDWNSNVTGNINQKAGKTLSIQVGENLYEKSGTNFAHQAGEQIHLKAGISIVLEAATGITLVVGGNSVVLSPAGVSITGTLVQINSGGSPGSGCGSSPTDPASPMNPDNPKDPDKADDGSKGTKM